MKLGLARVERLNLGLSAGAVAASYVFVTPHFAGSLALGACLEALNFGAIYRGAEKLFGGDLAGARSWVGVFSLRFVLLAGAIFVAMEVGANPAALLIGLSLAMPATVIDAWIHRPPVLDPATLPVLLEEESDDDRAYWESYSVWRPGRLLTTQRDDLLSEMAAEEAEREKREQIEAGAYGPQSSTEPEHPSRTANATRSIAADE
ncbi:MAG: ATP synthase subunit I [Deltaproteobacteria bacterium]|jgi:hypothetical protein|nr:ATP synthase subunit I [Deltaproteobacteria bacterium]MBW2496245.1 ATP synthase subunit I [Deltaproteobacteria bacterium]